MFWPISEYLHCAGIRTCVCWSPVETVNLSLERGNCDASCIAYVRLGLILLARFDDYQAGFRFGRLGYDLVEGNAD